MLPNCPRLSSHPNRRGRHAFTLVELLVVISIVGVLLALMLNGVSASREAARRMQCSNHLRQLGLGLHNFHVSHDRFPLGNASYAGDYRSWITEILPHLEQTSIAEKFDRRFPDVAPENLLAATSTIPTLRCPSSILEFNGDTDYAGVIGSALAGEVSVNVDGNNNGVLVEYTEKRRYPVSIPEIFDGSSYTICIAEVVDRFDHQFGVWADGRHCISHDNGGVNVDNSDEIFSFHPGGAHVVLSDGAVRFLNESISPQLVGSLCSRNGREDVSEVWGF